jgi:hypothetical protein
MCGVHPPHSSIYRAFWSKKYIFKKKIFKKLKFEKIKIPSSRLHKRNIFPKGQLNPIYVTGCARNDHHHDRCKNMNPPSFA